MGSTDGKSPKMERPLSAALKARGLNKMNNTVLQKVLDELNKESPSIDYLRGMLETLIATQHPPVIIPTQPAIQPNPWVPQTPWISGIAGTQPTQNTDPEARILNSQAAAGIAKAKELAQKSIETA